MAINKNDLTSNTDVGEESTLYQTQRPQVTLTADAMYGFVNEFLIDTYSEQAPTPDFHLDLWDLACDPYSKVAIAAPRRHAKTTAVSGAWALAMFLFKCVDFGIIAANTETQAIDILKNLKLQIKFNEKLRILYPHMKIIRDTQTEFITELEPGWQFRILAKGATQQFRGMTWGSKRPNLIILDDFENAEDVLSKDMRDKIRAKFMSDILLCGSKNCLYRVVGTILHEDSLLEGLMQSSSWKSKRYRAHNEDFSHILFPVMYDSKYFIELQKEYSERGILDQYAREILCSAIARGDTLFQEDQFVPMTDEDFERPMTVYVTTDFAISEKQKADYTVFLVFGIDFESRIYILHIEDFKMVSGQPLRIQETFFEINSVFQPEMFISEGDIITKSIKPYLTAAMARRDAEGKKNSYFRLEIIPSTTSKIARSTGMQARMSAHHVRWNDKASWFARAKHQIMQATPAGVKAKHDDIFDAFTMIARALDTYYQGMSVAEVVEKDLREYKDDMDEALQDYSGMCQDTGY